MNLLVIDDEKLVGSLVTSYLADVKEIHNVFWVKNVEDINKTIKKNNIKIVFLDLYLPKLEGFEVLKNLKSQFKDIKIIILSSYFDKSYITRAIDLGANGYLNKNINPIELKKSIDYVVDDRLYLCSECKQYKILDDDSNEINPTELKNSLSTREIEVLQLISEGHNSNEIADKLFITVSTVDFHKKSLFMKFGTNKSTKMVKIAVTHNII